MHNIGDAKRSIIEQLERSGPTTRTRIYAGNDFPASLITGALARLESDNEIRKDVRSSGQEYYERVKPSPVHKILKLFSK